MSRLLSREPSDEGQSIEQAKNLIQKLLNTAFGPSTRDKQLSIGPSGIGDPCDYCVAQLMAQRITGKHVDDRGSLATWIGTAIHLLLQELLTGPNADPSLRPLELIAENKILCGEIEGYGEIRGTTDLFIPGYGIVVDWKGTKKDLIKKYKLHGTDTAYSYQRDIYGKGYADAGYDVRYVANVFIPRDGWRFSDCWIDIAPFVYKNAEDALHRAEVIWNDYVVPGQIDELASDDDCWNCTMSQYMQWNNESEVIVSGHEVEG